MNQNSYTLPGMPDWKFTAPTLQHKGGAGFTVKAGTTKEQIRVAVRGILDGTTFTPDEVAFEAVIQAALNIDWQTMLGPYPVATAPLINPAPVTDAQKTINTELVDKVCAHLVSGYYMLQDFKK